VARVVPASARAAVLGDLHERFLARVDRDGEAAARRWYWRQAWSFVTRLPAEHAAHQAARVVERRWGRAVGIGTDLRLAARSLRKRPGLALTSVLILSIAVGVNTAVFSIVHAVLLRELPYPEPERLVMLWDRYPDPERMGDRSPVTLEHVRRWSEQDDLFSTVGAYESTSMAFAEGGWPERLDGAQVTAELLPMLGARPRLGRLLVPEDELEGAEPVMLLSDELWQTRFGGSADVLGRLIDLSGTPTRVVGVVNEGFWFYDPYSVSRSISGHSASAARFWTPLPREPQWEGAASYPAYRVMARLRNDVGLDEARKVASLRRLAMPPTSSEQGGQAEVLLLPLSEQVLATARPRLLGLSGAVALVLLIACVNLVSLLLVHLDSRRSEFAVRVALGGRRGRLARQCVVESSLLALIGAAGGFGVAHVATGWLVHLVPRGLPLAHRVHLDAGVVAFGVGLALATGVVVSLAASFRLDPRSLAATMAVAPRTMAGTRRSRRFHHALVSAEVALSLVLLVTATLLLRSLFGLYATDTGFDPRGVLTFEALMISNGEDTPASGYLEALDERVQHLPGVVAAGATTALPFSRTAQFARITTAKASEGASDPFVNYRLVTPDYFDAIGLPVRAGRAFDPGDTRGSPPVVIVNEAFAASRLPTDADPVGQVIAVARGGVAVDHLVVGVVADIRFHSLLETVQPIVYAPSRQNVVPFQRFAVRVESGDPLALVEPIRRAALEIDARQPLQKFISLEQLIGQSIEEERFYAQVMSVFAAVAVVLTLVGIYGVVAFTTRQRDREVGIRMALGASVGRVRGLVLTQGLVPVAIGLMVGCVGALGTGKVLRGLLHGIAPRDGLSFAVATTAFAVVAAAACLIPAIRASRADPTRVIREA